jgi:hypothetical protein
VFCQAAELSEYPGDLPTNPTDKRSACHDRATTIKGFQE